MDQTQRRAFTVVTVLLSVAVGTSLLGPFLPESVTMLTAVPTGLLVGVLTLLLGLIAVSALRSQSTISTSPTPLIQGPPPERPQQPPARTGAAFDATVSEAARDIRVKQVDTAATVPRDRLRRTAITIVETTRECTRDEAETLVSAGDWTSDPVARAFVSEQGEYSVLFRVLWWARPEMAYERAVSRTVTELRIRAEAGVPGYLTEADRTERAGESAAPDATGVLWGRVTALISDATEDTPPAPSADVAPTSTPEPSESDTSPLTQSAGGNESGTPPAATPGGSRDE